MQKKLTVFIEGVGSEFLQATITKEDLDNFKSSGLSWHEYCKTELELDGYWDVNNISHLTGITMDNAQLSIMIDEKEIWSGDYWSIFEENDEMTSNISSSEYGIMATGDNEIPNTNVKLFCKIKYFEYVTKNFFPKIYPKPISFSMNAITRKLISTFEKINKIIPPEIVPMIKEMVVSVACNSTFFAVYTVITDWVPKSDIVYARPAILMKY